MAAQRRMADGMQNNARMDGLGVQTASLRNTTIQNVPVQQLAASDDTSLETQDTGLKTKSEPHFSDLEEPAENDENPGVLSDDTEDATNGAELTDQDEFYAAQRQDIALLGETHHLEYKKMGDEFVLGVASTWADAAEIHIALRQKAVSATWRLRYLAVVAAHRAREKCKKDRLTLVLAEQRGRGNTTGNHRRGRSRSESPANRVSGGSGSARSRSRSRNRIEPVDLMELLRVANLALLAAIEREKQTITAFVSISATEFNTEVAEILGANMPAITLDTDATAGDANAVRYHTGTFADPIPVTWYKPPASYATVTVLDDLTHANVVLNPFAANAQVRAPGSATLYSFGVTVPNRPVVGTILQNTPKHGKTRTEQQRLNGVLTAMGHNMAGLDGDHVTDLGFGGNDVISNYWPLNSVTNRYAFTGWRSTYYLNYKTGRTGAGAAQIIKKAPLNAGNLVNKYVQIVAEQATANPAGNNTSASGSSTAWGAAQNIIESGGTNIPEG